jgi:hypothetical protein
MITPITIFYSSTLAYFLLSKITYNNRLLCPSTKKTHIGIRFEKERWKLE